MVPELGHFALIIALCVAIIMAAVPLAGTVWRVPGWVALARPAAGAQFLFLALAFAALAWSFVENDFSVAYVAQNSNSALPLQYRISAVWGGHEGSLLLWGLILGTWTFAVALFSRGLPDPMVARVISVMGMVSIGFLLFMLLTSNPFDRLVPPAPDGRDLNPLLQDPGLIFHPPMLYMGYVGFSVAFAFAIAALIEGRLDATWARWSRPWTIVAWVFMTFGIALGSWWAYYELGWGGWWFWDPVENASFMPWLVGTALIHSLAVSEKRNTFKNWTVLLAIFAFSLSLLGTFLVRSGVLTSVHAFASDPARGVFILAFLLLVIGGSLTLFAWRAPGVRSTGHFQLFSRETVMLSGNVLLVVAMGAVLLGTLYPLALDAFDLGKISVGPPYFNAVFVPLMAPLLFIMGFGPQLRWKQDDVNTQVRRFRYVLAVSVVAGILIPLVAYGSVTPGVGLGIALACWVVGGIAVDLGRRVRSARGLRGVSNSYWGMTTAHTGLAVVTVGIVLTSAYSTERDVRMAPGDSLELAGYTFTFDSVDEVQGPNYASNFGHFTVSSADGDVIAKLNPEKRIYRVQTMPMTEAGIDGGLFRDLFVAMGEPLGDGAWAVRIYHKPFIFWLWLGATLMGLGGILAASDRRYRLAVKKAEVPLPGAATAAGS
ncbi:MAG: heme lyase CcmF/NrfE family subunit [Gammaproteobacteria bacterium]|jgi:cytochrome c-type biogenesis protein CcmF|nr:heme lyase CcmF/NrfE family subunit [Gammaproteobacteria bacterium]